MWPLGCGHLNPPTPVGVCCVALTCQAHRKAPCRSSWIEFPFTELTRVERPAHTDCPLPEFWGSNPRGLSPMDFKSISLTTRTKCQTNLPAVGVESRQHTNLPEFQNGVGSSGEATSNFSTRLLDPHRVCVPLNSRRLYRPRRISLRI